MLSNTLLACALIAGVAGKLELKVFYETNCPFCQQTIIDEFDATRSSPDCLQEHVKFDWIPYGNANEAGGAVMCQHGPDECMGNKIHICAKEAFGEDDIGMNNFVVCHEKNIRGDQFANITGDASRRPELLCILPDASWQDGRGFDDMCTGSKHL